MVRCPRPSGCVSQACSAVLKSGPLCLHSVAAAFPVPMMRTHQQSFASAPSGESSYCVVAAVQDAVALKVCSTAPAGLGVCHMIVER